MHIFVRNQWTTELTIGHGHGGPAPAADLVGQPLKVFGQVGVLVAVRDHLDALVQHVVAELLELAHVLAPHQHEVLQVRLVLHRLQEERLEGGVVHRAPAAQEHKRLGLVQLLDLPLWEQERGEEGAEGRAVTACYSQLCLHRDVNKGKHKSK